MSDLSDHRLSAPHLLLDLKLCGDLLQCGKAAAEAEIYGESDWAWQQAQEGVVLSLMAQQQQCDAGPLHCYTPLYTPFTISVAEELWFGIKTS